MKTWAFLISVSVIWMFLILLMLPYQLPLTIGAIWFKSWRPHRYDFWIWQDQGVNMLHQGNPDITVSSRVGYLAEKGSKTALGMEKVIDYIFYKAIRQENHCRVSIERDEIHREFR